MHIYLYVQECCKYLLTTGKEEMNFPYCTGGTVTSMHCIPLIISTKKGANAMNSRRASIIIKIHVIIIRMIEVVVHMLL